MPEENDKPDDVKVDNVAREDYNKVVEQHNSLKAEKEKLEKEMEEIKSKDEGKAEETKESEWKEQNEKMQKQMDEMKDKMEAKVAKGEVENKEEVEKKEFTKEETKNLLDEAIDTKGIVDPKNFGSGVARYAHFKNPSTRVVTEDKLGRALSLHRHVPTENDYATPNPKVDIIVNK